jgi:hypothetical protein
VAAVALVAVTIVIFRLPESLIELMQRAGPLEGAKGDWAYRLLAVAAIAQAAFGGFVVLSPERVRADRELSVKKSSEVSVSVARNAAGMTCLTLVYGVAAFALTGMRGGFWLFVAVATAQGAWYYRAVGVIDSWLEIRPAHDQAPPGATPHHAYCPPLARGLIDARRDAR